MVETQTVCAFQLNLTGVEYLKYDNRDIKHP
jgi:hypothetical protein